MRLVLGLRVLFFSRGSLGVVWAFWRADPSALAGLGVRAECPREHRATDGE